MENSSSNVPLISFPLNVQPTWRALGMEKAMHSTRAVSPGVPNCRRDDVIVGGPLR